MGFDAIQHYFSSGWAALSGQANFSWSSITDTLNLTVALDIVFVLLLLWWVWRKIRHTALAGMVPKVGLVLLVMFLARLFGLIAVFYAAFAGLLVLLISIGAIYHQDLKKLWDSELAYAVIAKKHVMNGQYDVKKFLNELSDTVVTLAKTQTPALLVIRTMLIDQGVVIAAGSHLANNVPKRFLFSLNNSAIRDAANKYDALIIITHKDREDISLLHKTSSYTKLSSINLDRILKTILLNQ